MWSDGVPVQPKAEEERAMKRHHTARYYAHRVKESLTTRVSKLICSVVLGLVFLIGIITFILWLSLRPHRPRFYVQSFSIPGLSQEAGFGNPQILYNITARNSNQNIGIYYDAIQLTVFYQEDQSIGGAPVLHPFYQEPKNTTVIAGILAGSLLRVSSQQWQQFVADKGRGGLVFRVEITSTIRFKISSWDSKRHRIHVNCPVHVGPDGSVMAVDTTKKCPIYFS